VQEPNLRSLASGTEQQRAAYAVLRTLDLFAVLAPFDPALTGSVALGLEASSQRLQVHCYAPDLGAFVETMRQRYGAYPGFALWRRHSQGLPALVCRFAALGFRVEVCAQARPTHEQNAYRYTAAAAGLLNRAGSEARTGVRRLQREGLTAEAALAEYFSLPGNPRLFLVALATSSPAELDAVLARAARIRASCRYCHLVAEPTPGRVYADPNAVLTVDPRDAEWRRMLLIPRRHTRFLVSIPSRLQEDPLRAEALDRPVERHLLNLWLQLYYVVEAAFPEFTTHGAKWDGANTERPDAHAYYYNLLLLPGENPVSWFVSRPYGSLMAAYEDSEGPELPAAEQEEMAARLRAAMPTRGLLNA
jgi:hypothetical protein